MIQTLCYARLKTGERLRVAALHAPAGRYSEAIRTFLAHKGQPWLLHVDLANRGETDALQTTYYVGLLGRTIVGNVMIASDGRVGVFGHVFTHPQHRRKGICQGLMGPALADFRARGGTILGLGTGYDSPPYWIYHSFGFRGIEPGNGHMLYEAKEGDMAAYFAPASTRVVDARWEHWPGVSLLFMQPAVPAPEAPVCGAGIDPSYAMRLARGDAIRSYAYGVFGPVGFEGGFLQFQADRARLGAQAKVLVTRRGSVAGAAILQPDRTWGRAVQTLDLFVHPSFSGSEGRLLRALRLPRDAKVQAYLDSPSARRVQALRAAGFRREAVLKGQLSRLGKRADVLVYAR